MSRVGLPRLLEIQVPRRGRNAQVDARTRSPPRGDRLRGYGRALVDDSELEIVHVERAPTVENSTVDQAPLLRAECPSRYSGTTSPRFHESHAARCSRTRQWCGRLHRLSARATHPPARHSSRCNRRTPHVCQRTPERRQPGRELQSGTYRHRGSRSTRRKRCRSMA